MMSAPSLRRLAPLSRSFFSRDPRDPEIRMYRTGDRGRFRPDGCLDYLGRKDAQVRWPVVGRMAMAWLVTLPIAAAGGALAYAIANGIGGLAGVVVVFVILVGGAGALYYRSRATAVNPGNVNAEWDGALVPAVDDEPATAA